MAHETVHADYCDYPTCDCPKIRRCRVHGCEACGGPRIPPSPPTVAEIESS